ncbi:armadillo-type protein [Mycena latifolia]|nr:armadillo-type protein [Mycena latifolia]
MLTPPSACRHSERKIQGTTLHLLSRMSRHLGRHASIRSRAQIFDANMLLALTSILKSTDIEFLTWTCDVLKDVYFEQTLVSVLVDAGLCLHLSSMLRQISNHTVRIAGLSILRQMACQSDSRLVARALVDADGLQTLIDLLRSDHNEVLELACVVLGQIASHPFLTEVKILTNACCSLASLLSSLSDPVQFAAAATLRQISRRSETGAPAVGAALVKLLRNDDNIQAITAACEVLSSIAGDLDLIAGDPCLPLAALIGHPVSTVSYGALSALHKISNNSREGRVSVADAIYAINCNDDNLLSVLLGSSDINILCRTCDILSDIARTDDSGRLTMPSNVCLALVSLLRHSTIKVQYSALSALSLISSRSRENPEAIACDGLCELVNLLQSSSAKVLGAACEVLGSIAFHDTLLPAVIEAHPCLALTALLRHPQTAVALAAISVLSSISRQRTGARATMDAGALPEVGGLLQSADPEITIKACRLLDHIASEETLVPDLIDPDFCPALVAALVSLLQ